MTPRERFIAIWKRQKKADRDRNLRIEAELAEKKRVADLVTNKKDEAGEPYGCWQRMKH